MALSRNAAATLGRIGLLLLVGVVAYVIAFQRASRQVDAFCGRVSTDTSVAALPDIALEFGVKLQGPMVVDGDRVPRVRATVVNPFTMGDYACEIGASSMTGKVEAKKLGYRPGS
jgi:hypothetical protein